MAVIVVMGVAGSGKSVVGRQLAQRLDVPFCEGDRLHPAANVAKMASGRPLDDRDRQPWLRAIARWVGAHPTGVVTCSALKRRYRDRLRAAGDVRFVLLDPPRAELERRLARRRGHFMPAALLDSQLRTLQRPGRSAGVLRLSGRRSAAVLVERIARWEGRRNDPARDRPPRRCVRPPSPGVATARRRSPARRR